MNWKDRLPKSTNEINRAGGSIMHYVGWIMVFAVTATCTVLLFRQYAPSNAPWLPYAAIGAFEYGAIKWMHYHKHTAENQYQFLIGIGMTIVSVLAITLATGLELVSWFSASGVMGLPSWVQAAILWAMVLIIPLNVLAYILCSLVAPSHLTHWKRFEQASRYVDARDYTPTIVETESHPQLSDGQVAQLAQILADTSKNGKSPRQ